MGNKNVKVKSKRRIEDSSVKYIPVYTKKQMEQDEKVFNSSIEQNKMDLSSFRRLMINDLCNNTNLIDTGYIGNVEAEEAMCALKNPAGNWKVLLEVSDELMRISPHYYRMNKMYSNAALFRWSLDLYDVRDGVNMEVVKKSYTSLSAKLESMNLKHEFSKIMAFLPYQDIYCGLVFESQSDFFIQQIDYKICKLYEIQDGVYNFVINLSSIRACNLTAYPSYVRKAYSDYIDGNASNWYKPPIDKQICIKLNTQWKYPYPLLIGLVQDVLDLNVYKKLKLQSARTDNYKAIMIRVPIDEKSIDKPLLTPKTLGLFAEINKENMTDDIGILHTLGGDGIPISFKDSNNTRNNVTDAIDSLYDSSGLTREYFNGSSSGTAVTFSIENDSGFVYGVYRQFERWMNRFIKARKYNKSTHKFLFCLLDVTIFNVDTVAKRYKDAISMGVTVIDKYLAALDMTPSRVLGSYVVHQDIFNFRENFVPLSTSYNSSNTSVEPGRPTNKSQGEGLGDSGEKTRDSDANKDR